MKELNFRDWLEEKGEDPFTFWKNCKKKHNHIGRKRRELKGKSCIYWLSGAFDWKSSLLLRSSTSYNRFKYFEMLNAEWKASVAMAKAVKMPIVFGFGR